MLASPSSLYRYDGAWIRTVGILLATHPLALDNVLPQKLRDFVGMLNRLGGLCIVWIKTLLAAKFLSDLALGC